MFKKILIANRGDKAIALRRSQIAQRAQPVKGD
jgi:acetyl/propionyl-CoA carboxylase alpha subunit